MEMMNLKTEKINPLGGCLPIVVQDSGVYRAFTGLCSVRWRCVTRPGF